MGVIEDIFNPKKPGKSPEQIAAEKRQAEELSRLQAKEAAQKAAVARRRQGRGSLISGDDRGVRDTLG